MVLSNAHCKNSLIQFDTYNHHIVHYNNINTKCGLQIVSYMEPNRAVIYESNLPRAHLLNMVSQRVGPILLFDALPCQYAFFHAKGSDKPQKHGQPRVAINKCENKSKLTQKFHHVFLSLGGMDKDGEVVASSSTPRVNDENQSGVILSARPLAVPPHDYQQILPIPSRAAGEVA